MLAVAESRSFSDLIDRERFEDFATCSFDDADGFLAEVDEDFTLLVTTFDGFFEDFCECRLAWCFWWPLDRCSTLFALDELRHEDDAADLDDDDDVDEAWCRE